MGLFNNIDVFITFFCNSLLLVPPPPPWILLPILWIGLNGDAVHDESVIEVSYSGIIMIYGSSLRSAGFQNGESFVRDADSTVGGISLGHLSDVTSEPVQ